MSAVAVVLSDSCAAGSRQLILSLVRCMEAALRVITRLPLQQLWRDDGSVSDGREASLSAPEIKELLGAGPVHFVVADVGFPPAWTPARESYRFWKNDVQPHLVEPDAPVSPEDWPGEYVYFASRWGDDAGVPIIVLEKHH